MPHTVNNLTKGPTMDSLAMPHRLTFIGGGCLAQGLISGIYSSGAGWTDRCAIDITARRRESADALRIKFPRAFVTLDNRDPAIWDVSDGRDGTRHVVFICTLPMEVPKVCLELSAVLKTRRVAALPTVVTVCPGISVAQLQSWLPRETPIVRSMPNTPVMCRQGATALFPSCEAVRERIHLVANVIREVSPVVSVLEEETQLDVVAAFAGSAPAHFYYLIESAIATAESHGIPAEMAQSLVVQSCIGSGMLARDANTRIRNLREDVCVPGGSTEKAISHLRENGFPKIMQGAIEKSLKANREMKNVGGY